MKNIIKRYVPYATILAALYLLLPLMFLSGGQIRNYTPIVYYFVFPAAAVVSAVHYSWKNGLDFIFAVIAPVMYLPSMLIYNNNNEILLLLIYLVCGILGSFIGDMVYIDERKKKEKSEKKAVAIRMDKDKSSGKADALQKEQIEIDEDEQFYKKYENENYSFRPVTDDEVSEDEIDRILNETRRNNE